MSWTPSLDVPRPRTAPPGGAVPPLDADPAGPIVILGVAASDAHVVANQLIAFELRQLGYHVVNLGACTPVRQFAACAAEHPGVLAIVIGSINGHAVEDLTPLRAAKDRGEIPCPVIVGGNLSVGSAKSGNEAAVLHRLGADHVLTGIGELIALLGDLRAVRAGLSGPGGICAAVRSPALTPAS